MYQYITSGKQSSLFWLDRILETHVILHLKIPDESSYSSEVLHVSTQTSVAYELLIDTFFDITTHKM